MVWEDGGSNPASYPIVCQGLLLAETATSSHSKSQLTYNRLVVSTGPSTQVVAYRRYRPVTEPHGIIIEQILNLR